jgi:hypothetical protein
MSIDKVQLLAWIDEHAEAHTMPLVSALYAGMAERIRRGDFDEVAS